jgi:hypothetical protein
MTIAQEKLVYVVADYGDLHDLAFAEVTQKLYTELNDLPAKIRCYSVPPFDTYATGFVLGQLALNSALGGQQKFFVNTAPRKDDLMPRVNNAGEGFVYVRLYNGIELCIVNSGFSVAFIKDGAEEIRQINCNTDGSQFRSRDIFPRAFGKIMHSDYSELGMDVREMVPDLPENVICYTDGYGNMKISYHPEKLQAHMGKEIVLDINGRKRVAKITSGIFGVSDGQLCLAPGSSGWTLPSGQIVRFSEVVLRGGSAAKEFGKPPGGIPVQWSLS